MTSDPCARNAPFTPRNLEEAGDAEDDDCDCGRKRCTGDIDEDMLRTTRQPKPKWNDTEEVLSELASEHGMRADFITPRPSFRTTGNDMDGGRMSFDSNAGVRRSTGRYTPQQLECVNFKRVNNRSNTSSSNNTNSQRGSRNSQQRERSSEHERTTDPCAAAEASVSNPVVASAASLLKFLHANERRLQEGDSLLTELPPDQLSIESGYKLAAPSRPNYFMQNTGSGPKTFRAMPPTFTIAAAAAAASASSTSNEAMTAANAALMSRLATITDDSMLSGSTDWETNMANSEQAFRSFQTESNGGTRVATLDSILGSEAPEGSDTGQGSEFPSGSLLNIEPSIRSYVATPDGSLNTCPSEDGGASPGRSPGASRNGSKVSASGKGQSPSSSAVLADLCSNDIHDDLFLAFEHEKALTESSHLAVMPSPPKGPKTMQAPSRLRAASKETGQQ